ncbi:MAG: FAD-binding oxidoreductase [Pseudomonadota bacterium]
MSFELSLTSIDPVTHDTFRLRFPRPSSYTFKPGQATELSLKKEGWENEARPFTFTSLPGEDLLEFIIKSYPSHNGMTEQIPSLKPGDKVSIGDAWGAIEDRGPGVFIAGGAGITPFIAILRQRHADAGNLEGYKLLFSNKKQEDIILRPELQSMPGLDMCLTLSDENVPGINHGHIDDAFINDNINDFAEPFYVCGPPPMEEAVSDILKRRGVADNQIVREED